MSEVQLVIGRLYKTDAKLEDYVKHSENVSDYSSPEVWFNDTYHGKMVIAGGVIYTIVAKDYAEDYFCKLTPTNSGFEMAARFYNGSTCLSEILEEKLPSNETNIKEEKMKDIIKVELDETTIKNLERMIPIWENESNRQCNMGYFNNGDDYATEAVNICGTVTCGLGLCPLYIPIEHYDFSNPTEVFRFDWYGQRIFPSLYYSKEASESTEPWSWIFSGNWQNVDNTFKGVAKRARYMLDNGGIPKNWYMQSINYDNYIFGEE